MVKERELTPAIWKGSIATASRVADEITRRFGEEETARYDPLENCLTYNEWRRRGYQVARGQSSIRSLTFIKSKDNKVEDASKDKGRGYPKTCYLFYWLQLTEEDQVKFAEKMGY
jgi:hypothetical protein